MLRLADLVPTTSPVLQQTVGTLIAPDISANGFKGLDSFDHPSAVFR